MMQYINAIVVLVVVALTELAKKFIFKDNEKYKTIWTFMPIVLSAIAFLVIALIQKTNALTAIAQGAALGFTAMGSYDTIKTILKNWKTTAPMDMVKETDEVIKKK